MTDCNVMVGKLDPKLFPEVFGPDGDQPLDADIVRERFAALAAEIASATAQARTPEQIADGFLDIAVENMANAIKHISVQRGYDVTGYTLCSFGGAGGQHACRVADALGMSRVFIHPLAGVLSAYGMGLADVRALRQHAVEAPLSGASLAATSAEFATLEEAVRRDVAAQGIAPPRIRCERTLQLKYEGTDTTLAVPFHDGADTVIADFERRYRQQYGFLMPGKPLIIEAIAIEAIGTSHDVLEERPDFAPRADNLRPFSGHRLYAQGAWRDANVYAREDLRPGDTIDGPADHSRTKRDHHHRARMARDADIARPPGARARPAARARACDRHERRPRDARSVQQPVHGDRRADGRHARQHVVFGQHQGAPRFFVRAVRRRRQPDRQRAAHAGASRLDGRERQDDHHPAQRRDAARRRVRAQRAVQRRHASAGRDGDRAGVSRDRSGGRGARSAGEGPEFYVASRGHHADIGGITPGSMPPASSHVDEEGVLLDNVQLVAHGRFLDAEMRSILQSGRYPVRNVEQNLADLRAQVAACAKGAEELAKMVAHFGLPVVRAYMRHVQDNAEESVRRVVGALSDGRYAYEMDSGAVIRVAIRVDRASRSATIDFTGTSAQQPTNFNAPSAVCKAAVLYVFRTLVDDDIPMNAGCLVPLTIVIPDGSMLSPRYPAAVVAGNVETSQTVTDTLYGALGVLAASQGTMNNFTFGNDRYQYYETIAGGAGAGPDFDGASVVQTHMTNSRLTDPEVLEWRFPVRLEAFSVRRGSGGAGRHRGGDGAIRRVRFLEPMTAVMLANHRRIAPFGVAGGAPGALGRNWVERVDGSREDYGATFKVEMNAGDVLVVETPGGGGFGARNPVSEV